MKRVVFGRIVVGAMIVLSARGCSTQQPTVNQVQPNAIDKSILANNRWYYLQTVVDTPYGASFTFVGEQGPLEKIAWEIQEDYLLARRTYEFVANSEGTGISGGRETGAVVAMYRIASHFDIKRAYNPTTGEELNVVTENMSDRPWHERQYMRVDWSQNLVTNAQFLVLARLFAAIEAEPVAYYVQNLGDNHPHRPKFEKDSSGAVHYIDIVNKMFVRPTTVNIEGLGNIPSCLLMTQTHVDCAPAEITVRNSFLRADPAHDYQPMVYTGDRMQRFGYFVTERAGYDDHYGAVDPARYRFANRHNLWERSHAIDASGALVRCTSESDCSGGGSVCDLDYGRAFRENDDSGAPLGACTIAYRERKPRTVPYYVSQNTPAELLRDAEHTVAQWNNALVETVGSLRENECVAVQGDAATCASERTREDAQNMLVLCHNPVRDADADACGEAGTTADIGDLRYSLIGWVNEPHSSSPLGYGPSAADPETGEIIMGNAFVYGAPLGTIATFGRDIVALLNGDVTETDIENGELVRAWVEGQRAPGSVVTGRPADDHVVRLDGFDAERINRAMDFSWARERGAFHGGHNPPVGVQEFLDAIELSRATLTRNGAFGTNPEGGAARLQNLIGTDIERMMTTAEMRAAAGVDPSLPVDEMVLAQASPLRGMNPQRIRALEAARSRIAREACILQSDFADDGMLGLAREIARAADESSGTMDWYGQTYTIVDGDGKLDYEAVRAMLLHPIFDALVAHEIGHTLGLRHNFSGSYDALNYRSEYWELRNDGSMAPRAWDPLTQDEIDGRIREYQYSSVMDYGNNFVVTDANGIGYYDRAAIKMGYGDLVEVFTNAPEDVGPSPMRDISWYTALKSIGWPVAIELDTVVAGATASAYQYTDLPEMVGGIANIQSRTDVPYTSLTALPFLDLYGFHAGLVDASNRPVVPYAFCSDELAGLEPSCFRYDAGADQYEALQSVIDTYWNHYIFNAFRRGRLGFDAGPYAERILTRYFQGLQYATQIYTLYRSLLEDVFSGLNGLDTFFTRPDGMGGYTAGVGAGFELLTRVISAPEPGRYGARLRADGTAAYTTSGLLGGRTIDAFDGRFLATTWDQNAGFFWFEQLLRAGYFYDKVLALWVLSDPGTYFLGRDTVSDIRQYQINYYSALPAPMTSLFRALLGEDWATIGARFDENGELVYPDALNLVDRDLTDPPIDPNASFSVQLQAAVYGLSLVPQTFDQAFVNMGRIFVQGGAESVELQPGVDTVSFIDPVSGLEYIAASYPDEDSRETSIGAQMLLHAQALADAEAWDELARFVDNLNMMRRLTWLLGFGG